MLMAPSADGRGSKLALRGCVEQCVCGLEGIVLGDNPGNEVALVPGFPSGCCAVYGISSSLRQVPARRPSLGDRRTLDESRAHTRARHALPPFIHDGSPFPGLADAVAKRYFQGNQPILRQHYRVSALAAARDMLFSPNLRNPFTPM